MYVYREHFNVHHFEGIYNKMAANDEYLRKERLQKYRKQDLLLGTRFKVTTICIRSSATPL